MLLRPLFHKRVGFQCTFFFAFLAHPGFQLCVHALSHAATTHFPITLHTPILSISPQVNHNIAIPIPLSAPATMLYPLLCHHWAYPQSNLLLHHAGTGIITFPFCSPNFLFQAALVILLLAIHLRLFFHWKHAIPPLTYLFHSLSHFSHSHSLTLKTCSLTLSLSLTKNMQSLPWRTSSTKNVQSLPWLTSTADQKHAIPQLTSTAGASCPKAAKTRARRDSSWSCWAEKRTCVNRLGHHNLTYWMFILEGLPALRTGPDVQGFGQRSRQLTALKLSIPHPTHNTPAKGFSWRADQKQKPRFRKFTWARALVGKQ